MNIYSLFGQGKKLTNPKLIGLLDICHICHQHRHGVDLMQFLPLEANK